MGIADFPIDFPSARERFRRASAKAGASLEAIPLGGEAGLTLDVALLGDVAASKLMIVSSGLHGVEGPFGSAVQSTWLERGISDMPSGVAVLMLHGLNPHGFAHVRRFDESNVDLNRNFLIADQTFEGSPPSYATLDRFLNPTTPPGRFDSFLVGAVLAILRYGYRPLKQAVAGGQYDFPRGLFFGGHERSALQTLLAERLPAWVGSSDQILHLDYHTGLGTWGTYQLMIDHSLTPDQQAWLDRHFSRDRISPFLEESIAYTTRGSLGRWCKVRLQPRSYLYFCAEFGTKPALSVVAALRAENRVHHWGDPASRSTQQAKARLLEAFVPSDLTWRKTTVGQAVALIDQGFAALRF